MPPLVALGIQTQQPDIGKTLMEAQQIQAGQQQQQERALQIRQQQQAMQDQQTVMGVLQQTGGDMDKALPILAGKVSPSTFIGLQKNHIETKKAIADLTEKQLAVKKDQNDRLNALVQQASQLPDDQYAQAWPNIVQSAKQIAPDSQIVQKLDPAQPVPKAALPQFNLGLMTTAQYIQQQQEQRAAAKAPFEQKTAEANSQKATEEAARVGKVPGVDVPFSPEVFAQKKALKPAFGSITQDDTKAIADAIQNGDQPPTLQGLYRNGAPVRAELARRGVPIAKMETDWKATQKYVATLNGSQQTRLRQAISTASDSLDKIESLYVDVQRLAPVGGFKILNKAALSAMKNLPGEAGAKAQALDAQIADLTSELGNVYMGGNSPTDHALSLAQKNLSSDWNAETFKEALKQARLNLGIRQNSIIHAAPAGLSGQTNYFQQPQQQQPKKADPLGIF